MHSFEDKGTMQLKKNSGFTLIELMIVIAIIAIFISIGLPSYQKYSKRAHYLEIIEAAAPIKLAISECYEFEGSLTNCHSGKNGILDIINSHISLVNSITVAEMGIIHIVPNELYGISSSDDYYLIPKITKMGLQWHSKGGGVSAGYAR